MRRTVILTGIIVLALVYLFLPSHLARSKYPLKYQETIKREATQNELSPALVASLIYGESRFDPRAVSGQSAIGLMQIQLPTAKGVYQKPIDKEKLKEPEINIKIGTRYLKKLIDRYQEEELALIAYNLGPTALDKKLSEGIERKDLKTSYYFSQSVQQDKEIYLNLYSNQLELDSELVLSPYRLWKIILLSKI
jgi:soluble lytic murein transglycosylase